MSEEYQNALDGVAIFDLSHRSKVELRGEDRVSFLQNFSTNDVVQLKPGTGCEAYVTTSQARIVVRVLIFKGDESLFLDTDPGLSNKIIQHLDRYLITEKVELLDRTAEQCQFHVTGPESIGVLEKLGVKVQASRLCPLAHFSGVIEGATCQIRRNDLLGQMGLDLIAESRFAPQLWEKLREAGARPASLEVYDTLRIEAGTPEYGKDIDETNLPQEVGRDAQAISFTKGCYLGQEPVARILALGHVNRLLLGLKFESNEPGLAGAKVFRNDQEVGKVTSAALSPRMGSAVALAYIRRGHQEPGTPVEVEHAGARLRAQVSLLPFVATRSPAD